MFLPPPWRRRALTYQAWSLLPRAAAAFDLVRRSFGQLRAFDLTKRMYAVEEFAFMMQRTQTTVDGRRVLEIGAGWHPLIPAIFHGLGAERIELTDVSAHMRQEYVEQTVAFLTANVERIAAVVGAPPASLADRWQALRCGERDWRAAWAARGIEYLAPIDLRDGRLPEAAFDLVYSNSCLGYVPASALPGLFEASARILRPGGRIMHDISIYDDYSTTDRSLSPLNFLAYSRAEWDRIGNSALHHQNRLRPRDYDRLARQSGLEILLGERHRHSLPRRALLGVVLDEEFQGLPEEELLCAHYLLVARKASPR